MYVPTSTYRLQLHAGFPFAAAADTVEYLASLGVGACYTSPYFTATKGSTHGYDVVDHNSINPELGGAEAHAAFIARLSTLALGHIVDVVPNHMGINTEANAWWRDVLENGPSSPAARFFDIDWTPVKASLHAKLLLPILGDQYGRVLERGELSLAFRDATLVLRCGDQELPIDPKHVPDVLRNAVGPLTTELGADSPQLHEFLSILTSLQNLPSQADLDATQAAERQREKEVARARLARLLADFPSIGAHVEKAVTDINGEVGRGDSFDALHQLLEAQSYRLSYWRTASHDINYRRFFDVNSLAGLRVEDPVVFAATHQLIAELLRNNSVQGLRIDHPDGLFDPARYFQMLQQLPSAAGEPLYVVAEKVLSAGESLPRQWAVAGTTGYDYLNDLNGLFISHENGRAMRRVYTKHTTRTDPPEDVLYDSKRLIMATAMASELNVLAHALEQIAEGNRRSRDFTLDSLREAIAEVTACFPVYRTYVDECGWAPYDRAVVEQAIVRARRRNPAMEGSLFDFFREVMLPRPPENASGDEPRAKDRRVGYPPADAAEAQQRQRFAMKLQQYTGPVQAKGLEDTAFYRYNLLLSVNEVGGDFTRFGRSVEHFHEANAQRLRERPGEMLATSTHDTKVGEDTRARINVLSEIPAEWSREVGRWMRFNRSHRTLVDGEPAPDRNDEYRFYQALLGVWPVDESEVRLKPDTTAETAERRSVRLQPDQAAMTDLADRLQAFMLKSVKEAKLHTSWLTPNDAYEEAVSAFVKKALTGAGATKFLAAFERFAQRVARAGMINGLAQLTLKLGSPGVPDFYQGTELWDLTLVDPDNRRPIDFARRRALLDDVAGVLAMPAAERVEAVSGLVQRWKDGRIKMLLTAAGLRLRREWPDLFSSGRYVPLVTDAAVKGGLVAFARILDGRAVLFVAPRLVAHLVGNEDRLPLGGDTWKTSRILLPPELSGRTYRHELTGNSVKPSLAGTDTWLFAGQIFETVPAGILRAEPES
jgi:(1->4)-alpha-D-glucan 1-alpha-D-glucosylmutase